MPNSESNSQYLVACKKLDIKQHPPLFPAKLPQFFIRFLTQPGDIVLDIFAGSTQLVLYVSKRPLLVGIKQEYLGASALKFLKRE
ncbi:MAG: DNA methyltransferase [Wolbachia sp.]